MDEIDQLVELFSDSARRAEEAGFDLIEIHGAHGYLISSFLSPLANQRKDQYGGTLENRSRFPVQILKRSREKLSSDIPIGIRMNGQDNIDGGLALEEAKSLASLFEKAGMDFLDISAGVYGGYPPLAPMAEPQGTFIDLAEAVKGMVSLPVIGVGRIKDPDYADGIIEKGRVDLVALGRSLIADPAWPRKAAGGNLTAIQRCISCNQGCIDRVDEINAYGRPVSITCLLNPWVGREEEMTPVKASSVKRILVIGGGPAGLAFSSIAARRGHQVTLIEKEKELGGQFRSAAVPPAKQDFKPAIEYMVREAEKSGIMIKKARAYDNMLLKELDPHVVVLATGAAPQVPDLRGIENPIVVTAHDVLSGRVQFGHHVLIIGGGSVGLETADYVSSMGRTVQVLEMEKRFGTDLGAVARLSLRRRLKEQNVKLTKSFKVTEILSNGVRGIHEGVEEEIQGVDSIVLAVGVVPQNVLEEELKQLVPEVHLIGDAAKPRDALTAIHEGTSIACTI